LLSVAAENDGKIPCIDDLKHVLNRRLDHLLTGVKELLSVGLIDSLEFGYEPHNWNKFQYKSDTSNERVAKHRAKRNVTVTPPETETESEDNTSVLSKREDAPAKPKKPKAVNTPFPDSFEPQPFNAGTNSHRIVAGWPQGRIDTELERFAANHRQRGTVMKDWQSAWSTWVLNTEKFGKPNNGNGTYNHQPDGRHGLEKAIAARRLAEASQQSELL
jgi:hypothetical protein